MVMNLFLKFFQLQKKICNAFKTILKGFKASSNTAFGWQSVLFRFGNTESRQKEFGSVFVTMDSKSFKVALRLGVSRLW